MNSQDEIREYYLQKNQLPTAENLSLLEAVKNGDIAKVEKAFQNGAKPNYCDNTAVGYPTSLLIAARNKDFDIIKRLLDEGADASTKRVNDGNTPLHETALSGSVEICELLLKAGADKESCNAYGNTPLHLAVRCGNFSLLKCLIKNGAKINAQNHRGSTALHISSSLCSTTDERDIQLQIANYLSRHGIDVNATDINGLTALHIAAQRGCLSMAKVLIKNGANPAIQVFPINDESEVKDFLKTVIESDNNNEFMG